MFRRIPPALVVAAFVGVFGAVIAYCAELGTSPTPQWSYFGHGVEFAKLALISAGAFALSRRSTGTAHWLTAVAARISAAYLAWTFVRDIWDARLFARIDEFTRDQVVQLHNWDRAAFGIATIAAAVAITHAVSGWRRAPIAASLYLLAVCGRPLWWYFFPGAFSSLDDLSHLKLFVLCLDVVANAALLRMLVVSLRDRASAAADPPAAASGFRIAAAVAWCAIAVAIALFALDVSESFRVHATILFYASFAPLGCAVLCTAAILRVARSEIEGLSATRIVLGAAAVLWWVRIDFLHQLRGMNEPAWSTSGPLIAAGGTILIGSAIAAYARSRQDRELHGSAVARIILYAVLSITAAMSASIWRVRDPDQLVVHQAVTGLVSIGAALAFAGLFWRIGKQLAATPTIPQARTVSSPES